ncbi:unnamed protein product [Rotaria sp. Silwood1]|nr:unnamed protein product [Rotaria sp. Silwood1]
MVNESGFFIKDLKQNVCGRQLIGDYKCLNHFETLIRTNCNIIPDSLKYLRCTGYLMAIYNTLLMHVLLNCILQVSAVACIPILTSFGAGYIDISKIILLGICEFSQVFLSLVIMGTFYFLIDRKRRPHLVEHSL